MTKARIQDKGHHPRYPMFKWVKVFGGAQSRIPHPKAGQFIHKNSDPAYRK